MHHHAGTVAPAPPSGPERGSRVPWWVWMGGVALAVLVGAAARMRMTRGVAERMLIALAFG